jgi:hypothetical protein
MPSPFPGMDPWLERPAIFPDFHDRLIGVLSTALNAVLPAPFFSAIANRDWIEGGRRHMEPDVDVLHPPGDSPSPATERESVAVVADPVQVKPVIVRVPREQVVERYLEIHEAPDGEHLVTTIEVLSLSNKRAGGDGRREYLRKQRKILDSEVNLVEFDFLRQGRHTTAVALDRAEEMTGPFNYHVCVHRYDRPEDYEVYPLRLPQSLPSVAIPLRPGVADVVMNLQELCSQSYDVGRYERRIRYATHQPEPPLTDEQARWAKGILRAKNLLPTS